ncbi:hypothetical protein [Oricola nitratireducens]|uniref:hypothetical protein n=1 Tax=Oricola nitratireducens TaxID=2775868 RepID=UPI0018663230|nr:hypothetical protein [Oricola nitratireducens]
MTRTHAPKNGAIHDAQCGVWEIPETSSVDVILEGGYRDEAIASYLAQASPLYNALSRILAQLSGVLLLATTRGHRDLSLDHAIYTTAVEQLTEARERLRALKAPAAASRHYTALQDLAGCLAEAAEKMDSLSALLGQQARDDAKHEIIRKLHVVQRLLIATAEPDANITPVDFSHACCTCGASHTGGSEKNI